VVIVPLSLRWHCLSYMILLQYTMDSLNKSVIQVYIFEQKSDYQDMRAKLYKDAYHTSFYRSQQYYKHNAHPNHCWLKLLIAAWQLLSGSGWFLFYGNYSVARVTCRSWPVTTPCTESLIA